MDSHDRPRWGYAAYCVLTAGLLAGSAVQLARTYADDRTHVYGLLFNADFLSPAVIYNDVMVDGYPLRAYQHSAATFAVPDVAAYFAVRAAAGSAAKAMVPWQFVLFGLLVAAAGYALTGAADPAVRRWVWPALGVVTAVYLAGLSAQLLRTEARDLLMPVCHTGAQTCAFAALGLVGRYVRADRGSGPAKWLAGLAAVSAAAAFSDRLFVLYFAAPVALSLGVLRLAGRPGVTGGRAAAAVAAVGVGCAAAAFALSRMPVVGVDNDPIESYMGSADLAGAPARLGRLAGAVATQAAAGDGLAAADVLWLAAAGGVAAAAARRGAAPGLYVTYGLAAFAAVAAVFVVSKSGVRWLDEPGHHWEDYSRYFAGPQAVALFGSALAIAAAAAGGGRAVRAVALVAPAAAAAGLLAVTVADPRRADHDVFDPYPETVRALDEVCRKYGMTDGFGGYWRAKEATCFSRAGVRVRSVGFAPTEPNPVVPHVWLSNAEWYFRKPGRGAGAPTFEFVVADPAGRPDRGLPEAGVVAYFGPPAATVPAGDSVILVYNRPTDAKLHHYPDHSTHMQALRYRVRPDARHRFPGTGFHALIPHDDAGPARVAEAPRHPAGVLAYGPYLRPKKPRRHYAEFAVAAAGAAPAGRVDVFYDGPRPGEGRVLTEAAVGPATGGAVRLEFDVTPDMMAGTLQFRTIFAGAGRLTLSHVDFGRVGKE